jgi:hypothetical protein
LLLSPPKHKIEKRTVGHFHHRWVKLQDDVMITPETVIEKSRHGLSLSSEVPGDTRVRRWPSSRPLRAILPLLDIDTHLRLFL